MYRDKYLCINFVHNFSLILYFQASMDMTANVLQLLIRTVTLIGCIILVFGQSYSYLFLDIYGGDKISGGTGRKSLDNDIYEDLIPYIRNFNFRLGWIFAEFATPSKSLNIHTAKIRDCNKSLLTTLQIAKIGLSEQSMHLPGIMFYKIARRKNFQIYNIILEREYTWINAVRVLLLIRPSSVSVNHTLLKQRRTLKYICIKLGTH